MRLGLQHPRPESEGGGKLAGSVDRDGRHRGGSRASSASPGGRRRRTSVAMEALTFGEEALGGEGAGGGRGGGSIVCGVLFLSKIVG